MTFKEYLQAKKIDPKGFALAEPERFREFKLLFEQMHPDSFTAQKLFLINPIRRKYPLTEQSGGEVADKKVMPKAKMLQAKINIIPKKKE